MKKLTWLIAIFVILSMVLAACGGAATEAPAEEPAAQEPSTEAPAAAEPGETEGPAPAAQTGGWCSGTDIVFFPGGPSGGPFATVVYNGAVQAAADTGANVEYVWSDWDAAKMVTQLQQAVATNPDGIAIMGHPGDEAYQPIVDEAEAEGIVITSMNTQTPKLQAVRLRWSYLVRCGLCNRYGSRQASWFAGWRQSLPMGPGSSGWPW